MSVLHDSTTTNCQALQIDEQHQPPGRDEARLRNRAVDRQSSRCQRKMLAPGRRSR
jgi:hypothetical protein